MIPSRTEFTFSTRLRKEDVAYWKKEVEPIIRQEFDGNRTAFIMDAVRRAVAIHKRKTR